LIPQVPFSLAVVDIAPSLLRHPTNGMKNFRCPAKAYLQLQNLDIIIHFSAALHSLRGRKSFAGNYLIVNINGSSK
jgi:hypothetical protein